MRTTSPHRHPRSGIYKFRKRVPDRLRAILRRTEVTVSLGTRDPKEARRLHAEISAEIERRWAAIEATPRPQPALRSVALTEKQGYALAGEAYRRIVAAHDDNPGSSTLRPILEARARTAFALAGRADLDIDEREFIESVAGGTVDALLERMGLRVDDALRLRACRAVAKGIANAEAAIIRRGQGDWSPDPAAASFPPIETLDILDWRVEFDRYAMSISSLKTRRSWRRRVGDLMAHIGSDDLRRLTPDHLEAWRDQLLESGLHPKTVRDGYLAPVKALCKSLSRRLKTDPTYGVTVRRVKAERTRSKALSREEALTILQATLEPPPPRMRADQQAARRWVPWLCAYTGARVNEITQLRVADVFQERSEEGERVWVIRITPEAGNVKSGEAKTVPLHPHLIDQGFLSFVATCERPTLFYDARRRREGSQAHPLYQKSGDRIAAWVRSLGVDDPDVHPNHGWRHRFRTVARAAKIGDAMIDRLQGHAPASVGEEYGDRWPIVLYDAVASLPRYEVGAPQTG